MIKIKGPIFILITINLVTINIVNAIRDPSETALSIKRSRTPRTIVALDVVASEAEESDGSDNESADLELSLAAGVPPGMSILDCYLKPKDPVILAFKTKRQAEKIAQLAERVAQCKQALESHLERIEGHDYHSECLEYRWKLAIALHKQAVTEASDEPLDREARAWDDWAMQQATNNRPYYDDRPNIQAYNHKYYSYSDVAALYKSAIPFIRSELARAGSTGKPSEWSYARASAAGCRSGELSAPLYQLNGYLNKGNGEMMAMGILSIMRCEEWFIEKVGTRHLPDSDEEIIVNFDSPFRYGNFECMFDLLITPRPVKRDSLEEYRVWRAYTWSIGQGHTDDNPFCEYLRRCERRRQIKTAEYNIFHDTFKATERFYLPDARSFTTSEFTGLIQEFSLPTKKHIDSYVKKCEKRRAIILSANIRKLVPDKLKSVKQVEMDCKDAR